MTAGVFVLALALAAVPRSRVVARAAAAGFPRRQRSFSRLRGPGSVIAPLTMTAAVVAGLFGAVGLALAICPAAAAGGILLRRNRLERHRAAQRRVLANALEVAIGELRVGAHPAAAAEVSVRECSGDVAAALAACAGRARLGGDAASGLRMPSSCIADDLERVAVAWGVAEEHGLALADLLAAARQDVVGRIRFRERAVSASAGARASAAVLATLPLPAIGLGQLMGAEPLRLLAGGGPGAVLLIVGVSLVCAGLLWSDAIAQRVVGP